MNKDVPCLNSYLIYILPAGNINQSPSRCIKYKCYCNERGRDKDKYIHLSLSVKELFDAQSNDIFYSTMLKLINDKKVSSDRYFVK